MDSWLKEKSNLGLLILVSIGLLISVIGISNFPAYKTPTLIITLLITGLFLTHRALIFALLPSVFIIFDLSSVTGRFIVNELDFILIPTVLGSIALLHGTKLKLSHTIPLLLFVLLVCFSATNLTTADILSASMTNPYFDDGYRYRVAKGFIYGAALAVCFLHCKQQSTKKLIDAIVYGGVLASFSLFILVCWERGVWLQLVNMTNWWQPLSQLLDFSSSYRVTALTSAMHTGGEAYDGYLLYIAPLCLLGCLYWQKPIHKLLALLAVFCIGYCVLVGFTRTTYVAVAIGLAVLFIASRKIIPNQSNVNHPKLLSFGVVNVGVFVSVFSLNGYMGVASCAFVLLSLYISHFIRQKYRYRLPAILIVWATFALAIYLLATNESKWLATTPISLLISAFILLIWVVFIQRLFNALRLDSFLNVIYGYVSTVGIALILIAAGSGYQINARMDTVVADVQGRMAHWMNVAKSGEKGLSVIMFGNGFGSFPLNYVLTHPEKVTDVGNFTIRNQSLILNKGIDMGFGQRVDIRPNTEYLIRIKVDKPQEGSLSVNLCEKNLIFSSNFRAKCSASMLKTNLAQTEYVVELNSSTIGINNIFGWPATLYLKHSKGEPIHIESIHMAESDYVETNLLKNYQFEQGMDYWFFFNDYEHLPWHIKNTYLGFFYQCGVVGLMLLAWMFASIFFRKSNAPDEQALIYLGRSYLAGVAVFGVFGDPFDAPRASILFSIIVFGVYLVICNSKAEKKRLLQLAMTGFSGVFIVLALLQIPKFASYWSNFSFYAFSTSPLNYEEIKPEKYRETSITPGEVWLDGRLMPSITQAAKAAKVGSEILLRKGYYNEAAIISKDNIRIVAEKGAVIFGKAAGGKGALVLTGDNVLVKGLECHSIEVPDGNGVCIRFEGKGIILEDVYFHHAQGGFLGTPKGGHITIVNSRFEYLGNNGFYHGIYTLENTELFIKNSSFINTFNGGHEIKSRSQKTTIEHSIIANSTTGDSRLVDVPNGGELNINNSVLVEGPYSENFDLLSFGVEGQIYNNNSISINNNLIVSDRNDANLIALKGELSNISIQSNYVIGQISGVDKGLNEWFANRSEFGLPAAPVIPTLIGD